MNLSSRFLIAILVAISFSACNSSTQEPIVTQQQRKDSLTSAQNQLANAKADLATAKNEMEQLKQPQQSAALSSERVAQVRNQELKIQDITVRIAGLEKQMVQYNLQLTTH